MLQSYFCGPVKLPEANCFVDPGVLRSVDESFSDHITVVIKNSQRLIGLCARSLSCQDVQLITRVCSTYILSVLNYASCK